MLINKFVKVVNMAIEIEHKYLLKNNKWRKEVHNRVFIRDGLIFTKNSGKMRVRVFSGKGYITIKTKKILNYRDEYEYEIPVNDANKIIDLNSDGRIIEKYRNYIQIGKNCWEIDEYTGLLEGIIIAEVELQDVNENFQKPDWVGQEVTNDERFRVINMIDQKITQNWEQAKIKMMNEILGEYLFPQFFKYN